jgi:hypothetical protein
MNIIIEFVLGKDVELLLENRAIMAIKSGGVSIENHKLGTYTPITELFTEYSGNPCFSK